MHRPPPSLANGPQRGPAFAVPAAPATARAPDFALVDRVRARLADSGEEPTAAHVAAAIRAEGRLASDSTVLEVVTSLRSEMDGLGPLAPLLRDPAVTDVLVNAADEVWIDGGDGLRRTAVRFPDEAAVRRLAQRLASLGGRRLDDAMPYVDARLPDGIRVHAVLPPLAPRATCLSLRIPRRRVFTLDELARAGTVNSQAVELLGGIVASRTSYVITGGAGVGKTSLLSCLLGLVPPGERIVLVEDAAEVSPEHPHVVRLEARPANVEGAGEVALRDLVRQALRMRPDRLVVGEVRGGEVVDLLAALNTGHEGGCGTLHANAAREVPARVEALAVAAGVHRAAVHSQLSAGLHVVIHMGRDRAGVRRVREIGVTAPGGGGLAVVEPAVVFTGGGVVDGPGRARLDQVLTGRVW
jgi:pilus assembly protein CpaF